jgi:hypothetical protein
VTQRDECAVSFECREATEPATGDVLEEDALDRLPCTEAENLLERRTDEPRGRDRSRL